MERSPAPSNQPPADSSTGVAPQTPFASAVRDADVAPIAAARTVVMFASINRRYSARPPGRLSLQGKRCCQIHYGCSKIAGIDGPTGSKQGVDSNAKKALMALKVLQQAGRVTAEPVNESVRRARLVIEDVANQNR